MNLWNIGLVLVEFLLTVGVSLVITSVLITRWIGPMLAEQIGEELSEEFELAKKATSHGMSAMGVKSQQMREVAEIEGLVSEGVLSNYPELQMFLESVNPDLYDQIMEKIRENPEIIHILYERWGHLLSRRGARGDRDDTRPKYPRL